MYHETTPLITFICNKHRPHEIFLKSKLQITQLKTSISTLGFKKYFLISSDLQTFVPPNLWLLLRLSRILNIFNISFSCSLNRLNILSPYQKFVQISNAKNLGSGFIQELCSRNKHCNTASLIKILPLKVGVYLILEVHNALYTDSTLEANE